MDLEGAFEKVRKNVRMSGIIDRRMNNRKYSRLYDQTYLLVEKIVRLVDGKRTVWR